MIVVAMLFLQSASGIQLDSSTHSKVKSIKSTDFNILSVNDTDLPT